MKTHFREWGIPGPAVPGTAGDGPEVDDGETLDALCGQFRIFQLKKGHRFSTDDILTAWYGTSWCPRAEAVLDLGSGIGTVAMVAAWRLPGARVVTVEAQEESVRLARKSVAWNGLGGRYEIRQGDIREDELFGAEERFDLVLGSPPYFPPGSGSEGDHPQKVACRFELRGTVADYCSRAAKQLARGGVFACVFAVAPREQEMRVEEAAAAAGMTIVRKRPVVLRDGDRPLIGVFAMMRDEDLPPDRRGETWSEPPLVIRRQDGSVHPEYAAVKMSFGFPP